MAMCLCSHKIRGMKSPASKAMCSIHGLYLVYYQSYYFAPVILYMVFFVVYLALAKFTPIQEE